jgi:hypothetical protein
MFSRAGAGSPGRATDDQAASHALWPSPDHRRASPEDRCIRQRRDAAGDRAKVEGAIRQALADPTVRDKLEAVAYAPDGRSGEEFRQLIDAVAMKKQTGARWEITVDGKPRPYPVREAVRTQPACGANVLSRIKNQTARAMIVIPMTIRSPVIRLGAGA